MLKSLYVKNMALIDEIQVDFQKGLNIMTGETGSGKSIIVGSIVLALGGRLHSDILRKGAEYGLVELRFLVENAKQRRRLEKLEIYPDDDVVVISRKILEGRSTTKINGETASLNLVKKVAALLIHMYGQAEHQILLSKEHHLQILDDYLGEDVAKLKETVKEDYDAKEESKKAFQGARIGEDERRREADFLSFEISEIENANLISGEDDILEETYKRMLHGKKMKEHVLEAYAYISDSNTANASDLLARAIRSFLDVASFDEKTKDIESQLLDIEGLLNDCSHEMSAYAESLNFSPAEFEEVEGRVNEINHLKSKYGKTIADILSIEKQKRERLAFLENYEENLEKLRWDLEKKQENLKQSARKLSQAREEGAHEFSKVLEESIQELNFTKVTFQTHFTNLEEPTENGAEEMEFYISMNTGVEVAPLSNVVSGGELSRIMLAVKTILAKRDGIETLVFDEIDTGISGRTAQKVADKMAILGKTHQVICITHLAQIAAKANLHFVIEKEVVRGDTRTMIEALNEEQSVDELARILGGAKMTEAVRMNAREMKKGAKTN